MKARLKRRHREEMNMADTTDTLRAVDLPRIVRRCPACDSRGEFYTGATGTNFEGKWMVSCAAQDFNFHGEEDVSDDWCPAEHGSETTWFSTPLEAAEEWERLVAAANDKAVPTEGGEN